MRLGFSKTRGGTSPARAEFGRMLFRRALFSMLLLAVAATAGAGQAAEIGKIINKSVPQPIKPVDPARYRGIWYEIGRYENLFERGCEGVSTDYELRPDGLIQLTNTCRKGSVNAPAQVITGKAKVVNGSANAKMKVSFFGPFFIGDYWVLDHAPDYSWSIMAEPTGRYLWLLTRAARPTAQVREAIQTRARQLGYDLSVLHPTQQ
jgi:apolipoprotein D and lipocalin family protein